MPTDLIRQSKAEQFMTGYTPSYAAIYQLFLGNSIAYPMETGQTDFRRVNTIGDVRGKHIFPKDTIISQVNVGEAKKTFKRYYLATQYQNSELQNQEGTEDIVAQVLDEHHIQADELFLFGEGTAANNVLNNGLYWSADPNYILQAPYEIKKDANGRYMDDMYSAVMNSFYQSQSIGGRKLAIFYGNVSPVLDHLMPTNSSPLKISLQAGLGDNTDIIRLPTEITPANANGWIIASMEQIKLHYSALPSVIGSGTNEEKLYSWWNFLMGPFMTDIAKKGGIVRQPTTLQA